MLLLTVQPSSTGGIGKLYEFIVCAILISGTFTMMLGGEVRIGVVFPLWNRHLGKPEIGRGPFHLNKFPEGKGGGGV